MKRTLTVLALVTAILVGTATSFAAWIVIGSGTGSSRARTVGAGNAPTATGTGRNVAVTWTASELSNVGPAVSGYAVKRFNPGHVSQTINASCAGTISGTTCTEHAVPPGTWRYTVTPKQGAWSGAESADSAPVTIGSPTLTLSPPGPVVTLPATLSGTITNFVDGESLTFHLDSAGGTTLSGTVNGSSTPASVPIGGSAGVTISLPGSGIADGAHTVFAVTAPSGESATASFTVDTAAPTAAVTFPTPGTSYNVTGWNGGCGTPATGDVCGTSSDGSGSGIANVKVSVRRVSTGNYWNGTSFSSSSEVLFTATGTTSWSLGFAAANFTADDSYTLRAVATDTVGLTTSSSVTFTRDVTVPPTPSITSNPANPSNSATATFQFTDTEGGVTFQCQLDGAGFSTCTSPKVYSSLADGSHTFLVRAVDAAGNQSGTASYTWTVDTAAPTVAVTFPTAGTSYNVTGWNGGCGTPATGDVCGTSSDGSGSGIATVKVSVRRISTGNYWNGTSFSSSSEVLFTATGTTSWSLGFAAANFTADDSYTLRAVATDSVGLTTSSSVTFTRDVTVPPTPSITSNPANPSNSATATFQFTDTEAGVTFQCQLDGAGFSACTSPKVYSSLADGSHTFLVRAVDAAGNQSGTASYTWTVDATAPTPTSLTIANHGTTPGKAEEDDTVTVVFSERLSVASMCSTWSGDGTNQSITANGAVTVTITDGGAGNDSLTVSTNAANCGSNFHFGAINLGSTGFVTTTRTFSGSGSNATTINWNATTFTLTILLGTPSGATVTVSGAVTATYTPDANIKDSILNGITGTASRNAVQF